jgi:hypothetical protein
MATANSELPISVFPFANGVGRSHVPRTVFDAEIVYCRLVLYAGFAPTRSSGQVAVRPPSAATTAPVI